MPSHHTPPSGVRATLVKIVFRASVAIALGLVAFEVPGATPKKPASGLIARSRPSASGLIQAMSSPTVQTFHPLLERRGRHQHREVGLAAGAGEGGGHVRLLALRILDAQDQHVLRQPALVAGDVGGDPQARSTSCRAGRCRRSPIRSSRSRGSREMDDVLLRDCRARPRPPAPARAAPRRCACTARPVSRPCRSRRTRASPIRVMIRMFTTT